MLIAGGSAPSWPNSTSSPIVVYQAYQTARGHFAAQHGLGYLGSVCSQSERSHQEIEAICQSSVALSIADAFDSESNRLRGTDQNGKLLGTSQPGVQEIA